MAGCRLGAQHISLPHPIYISSKVWHRAIFPTLPAMNYSSLPLDSVSLSVQSVSLLVNFHLVSGAWYLDKILGFLGSGTVSSSSCLWKKWTQLQAAQIPVLKMVVSGRVMNGRESSTISNTHNTNKWA